MTHAEICPVCNGKGWVAVGTEYPIEEPRVTVDGPFPTPFEEYMSGGVNECNRLQFKDHTKWEVE